jgi:hypothetical protein
MVDEIDYEYYCKIHNFFFSLMYLLGVPLNEFQVIAKILLSLIGLCVIKLLHIEYIVSYLISLHYVYNIWMKRDIFYFKNHRKFENISIDTLYNLWK